MREYCKSQWKETTTIINKKVWRNIHFLNMFPPCGEVKTYAQMVYLVFSQRNCFSISAQPPPLNIYFSSGRTYTLFASILCHVDQFYLLLIWIWIVTEVRNFWLLYHHLMPLPFWEVTMCNKYTTHHKGEQREGAYSQRRIFSLSFSPAHPFSNASCKHEKDTLTMPFLLSDETPGFPKCSSISILTIQSSDIVKLKRGQRKLTWSAYSILPISGRGGEEGGRKGETVKKEHSLRPTNPLDSNFPISHLPPNANNLISLLLYIYFQWIPLWLN